MAEATGEVEETQARRFRAMVEGDLEVLEDLLAEDLVYVHSTAAVDTKGSFLESLRSRALRYRAVEVEALTARAYGSAAVVTGTARMAVEAGGRTHRLRIRFTDVYARPAGRWQQVAWQSTRVPEDAR